MFNKWCFTISKTWCLLYLVKHDVLLYLASRATIGARGAADRLRDRDNAAGIGDNSAEIGDNSAEIGDNSAEIGDGAAGIADIGANVIPC